MDFLVAQIKWVMLAGGLITMSMLLAAISPVTAFRMTFGQDPEGPLSRLVGRSWGFLVFSNGVLLVWGAFHPEIRLPVLVMAALGKLHFVVLCLTHAPVRSKAMFAIVIDSVLAVLFLAYVAATL